MKSFALGTLKLIWTIIRWALIIVGTVGAFLSVLLFLLCVFGLLMNALVNGWAKAFDLTLAPLLVSVGAVFGFSLMRAIGKFNKES